MTPSATAPAPTIVSHRASGDLDVTVRFDPRAAAAATEVLIDGSADLTDEEYLGLVTAAAARLSLYAYDFRAAMQAQPNPSDGHPQPVRRARTRAGGHIERRRRQAHAYRPLSWAGHRSRP